jgi:hypothetical protein
MAAIASNGTGGGLWSAGASWTGGVKPAAGDTVTVAATDTITFDQNDTGANTCLSIVNNGIITFSTAMTTQMTLGSSGLTTCLTFGNGSTFNMGTVASPILAAYTATLKLDTDSENGYAIVYSTATARWNIAGDPAYNSTTQVIDGYTTGTYTTTLASTAAAAATTLVLATDPGWRAGGADLLVVWEAQTTASTGSQGFAGQEERFTSSSYNSGTKTVTLPSGLANSHVSGGRVVNFSRNVIITGTSTSRRPGMDLRTTTGAAVPPEQDWRHCLFSQIGNISGANSSSCPLAMLKMVGVAMYIPTSLKEVGTYYAPQLINCHFYFAATADHPRYLGTLPYVNYCTFIQAYMRSMLNGGNISNSNFCGGFVGGAFNQWHNATITNCTVEEADFPVENSQINTFNSCTFKNISYFVDSAINTIFNSCTGTNIGYLSNNNILDIIVRGGSFAVTSGYASVQNDLTREYIRQQRHQDTAQGTFTIFLTGTLTRYTSGTIPDASVFPLPSGSTYASKLVPTSNMQYGPVVLNYSIAVTNGQIFTFTVPIMPRFSSTFTTDDVYVEIIQPGTATTVRSLRTLGASGEWAYLNATGTAYADGVMTCKVTLKKTGGNYYVDFPLGMASTGYTWLDGLPNENMVPLAGTPAADVWGYLTSNITAPGTIGFFVKKLLTVAKFLGLK